MFGVPYDKDILHEVG